MRDWREQSPVDGSKRAIETKLLRLISEGLVRYLYSILKAGILCSSAVLHYSSSHYAIERSTD
jgi:hypothetical protein